MQQTTKELILAALNHERFNNQKELAEFLEVSDPFISEILAGKKKGSRSFLAFKTKLDPILSDPYDEIDPDLMHKNLDIIIQSHDREVIRAINRGKHIIQDLR